MEHIFGTLSASVERHNSHPSIRIQIRGYQNDPLLRGRGSFPLRSAFRKVEKFESLRPDRSLGLQARSRPVGFAFPPGEPWILRTISGVRYRTMYGDRSHRFRPKASKWIRWIHGNGVDPVNEHEGRPASSKKPTPFSIAHVAKDLNMPTNWTSCVAFACICEEGRRRTQGIE